MATKEEKLAEALQQLMDDGFTIDEIKEMGLTESELLAFRKYAKKEVIPLQIELDDSNVLSEEEFAALIDEGMKAVKGAKTLREGILLLGTVAQMALKYKTLGAVGA